VIELKIADIREGMSNISLEAKVIEISETRSVRTRFGRRDVADALIKDETGEISLTLWQDQINTVKVGDRISIRGAFVTRFKEKLQVNVPRSGKIEVIE